MRAVSSNRRLVAAVLLAAASCAGVGCGGSDPDMGTETGTAASAPEPVSVLGSRVAVGPRRVTLALRLRQPEGVDPPTARTAVITLRGDFEYRGDARPTCTAATIERDGADACPPGSVIGAGAAVGTADTAQTRAAITVLNGGPDTVLLATVVRHPVYAKSVVRGTVTAPEPGALRIAFAFPPSLQTVGGVPVGLQRLDLVLRRGGVVAIGPCPTASAADARWRYAASVAFADESVTRHTGDVTCSGTS